MQENVAGPNAHEGVSQREGGGCISPAVTHEKSTKTLCFRMMERDKGQREEEKGGKGCVTCCCCGCGLCCLPRHRLNGRQSVQAAVDVVCTCELIQQSQRYPADGAVL
jgi:hypothetical protein